MEFSVLSSVSSVFDDDNMEESSDFLRINNLLLKALISCVRPDCHKGSLES